MQLLFPGAALFALTVNAVKLQRESATSEGHGNFWNLGGEHFSVNQPGDYLLLRLPQGTNKHGKLIFRGDMMAMEGVPCGVNMQSITVYGEWLGEKVLHVGLRNGFGIKVSSKSPAFAGPWRTFEKLAATTNSSKSLNLQGLETIPQEVNVTVVAAGEKAADGKTLGPAFQFHVGQKSVDNHATIVVARSTTCNCLDVSLSNLRRLQERTLGGLLGTEKHNQAIERLTPQCAAARKNKTAMGSLVGTNTQLQESQLRSSWSGARPSNRHRKHHNKHHDDHHRSHHRHTSADLLASTFT